MAELVLFPGVRREPLPSSPAETEELSEVRTSETVLQEALAAKVDDVVVIGWSDDGTFYVAAEHDDAEAVAGKLLRAANWMASASLDIDYIEE